MDKNTSNREEVQGNCKENYTEFLTGTCPICEGIGFKDGHICTCITGKGQPEVPEFLRQIFGVRK